MNRFLPSLAAALLAAGCSPNSQPVPNSGDHPASPGAEAAALTPASEALRESDAETPAATWQKEGADHGGH